MTFIEVSHENGVWKREDEAWRKASTLRGRRQNTESGLKRDCSEECPGNGDGAARLECEACGEPENKLVRKNGFRGISVTAVALKSRRH